MVYDGSPFCLEHGAARTNTREQSPVTPQIGPKIGDDYLFIIEEASTLFKNECAQAARHVQEIRDLVAAQTELVPLFDNLPYDVRTDILCTLSTDSLW